jgi:hypothetical protein
MIEMSPLYMDSPLCRFLICLHEEIEEVAACEAGHLARRPKLRQRAAFRSTVHSMRRETSRRQYR